MDKNFNENSRPTEIPVDQTYDDTGSTCINITMNTDDSDNLWAANYDIGDGGAEDFDSAPNYIHYEFTVDDEALDGNCERDESCRFEKYLGFFVDNVDDTIGANILVYIHTPVSLNLNADDAGSSRVYNLQGPAGFGQYLDDNVWVILIHQMKPIDIVLNLQMMRFMLIVMEEKLIMLLVVQKVIVINKIINLNHLMLVLNLVMLLLVFILVVLIQLMQEMV